MRRSAHRMCTSTQTSHTGVQIWTLAAPDHSALVPIAAWNELVQHGQVVTEGWTALPAACIYKQLRQPLRGLLILQSSQLEI